MSAAGRGSCDNTLFEWMTDVLDNAAANRQIEGDDASADLAVEVSRLGNYTQISRKVVQTSGTAQKVDFAGRKSSHAYQLAKASKELKRDMESMLLDNTAKSAGEKAQAEGIRRLPEPPVESALGSGRMLILGRAVVPAVPVRQQQMELVAR